MSYIAVMDRRSSVRTYSDELPGSEVFSKIKKIVTAQRRGPFGNSYSFILMDTRAEDAEEIERMSSYGFIKGARFYFGGYSDPDDISVIDYGYCFQEAILELTSLGLGTCWLGGTFDRSYIAMMISLPERKIIPAVSPIGLARNNSTVTDKIVRFFVRASKRKPQDQLFFSHSETNVLIPFFSDKTDPVLKQILESVRLAPSASNKQPWRIVIQAENIHLYWDFDKKYNSGIKGFNIQALDMGIAVCHFQKAAIELNYPVEIIENDPLLSITGWKYVLSWNIAS